MARNLTGLPYKCPICSKPFKSDNCPHSIAEVERYLEEDRIRRIVREEIVRIHDELHST